MGSAGLGEPLGIPRALSSFQHCFTINKMCRHCYVHKHSIVYAYSNYSLYVACARTHANATCPMSRPINIRNTLIFVLRMLIGLAHVYHTHNTQVGML